MVARDLELLLQASRTSPALHEAAVSVEWAYREAHRRADHAETSLATIEKMARRGVGPDTTAEQVLETIATYVSIRREDRDA